MDMLARCDRLAGKADRGAIAQDRLALAMRAEGEFMALRDRFGQPQDNSVQFDPFAGLVIAECDADAIGQVRAPDIGQPHPCGSAVGFGHCASLLTHASPVDFLSGKRQNPFLTPVTIVRCGREG